MQKQLTFTPAQVIEPYQAEAQNPADLQAVR